MTSKITIPVEVYSDGQVVASFDVTIENLVTHSFLVNPEEERYSAAVKAYAETFFASQNPFSPHKNLCVVLGRASTEHREIVSLGRVERVYRDGILVEERSV